MELALFYFVTIAIVIKAILCDHQFISVLIVWGNKKSEKTNNKGKEPTSVGEPVVDFLHASIVNISILIKIPIHNYQIIILYSLP